MSFNDRKIDAGLADALLALAVDPENLDFAVQDVRAVQARADTLYGKCMMRLTDLEGVTHEAFDIIPALGRIGMLHLLDLYGLVRVLNRLADDPSAVLGCNVSAQSLESVSSWKCIFGLLQAKSFLAKRLVLELSEEAPLNSPGDCNARMQKLRGLGCRIAIDRFGAGFPHPLQLHSLQFDIIKIAGAFVRNARTHALARSGFPRIVEFARCFAPVVVVDGIETARDLELAQSTSATHVQGRFVSRPVFPATSTDGADEGTLSNAHVKAQLTGHMREPDSRALIERSDDYKAGL